MDNFNVWMISLIVPTLTALGVFVGGVTLDNNGYARSSKPFLVTRGLLAEVIPTDGFVINLNVLEEINQWLGNGPKPEIPKKNVYYIEIVNRSKNIELIRPFDLHMDFVESWNGEIHKHSICPEIYSDKRKVSVHHEFIPTNKVITIKEDERIYIKVSNGYIVIYQE